MKHAHDGYVIGARQVEDQLSANAEASLLFDVPLVKQSQKVGAAPKAKLP